MPLDILFESLLFAASLLLGGCIGVLIGHLRSRTLLWVICISSSVIIFYFVARIARIYTATGDLQWLLWASLGGIVTGSILFVCLRKRDLIGEVRDIRLKIQQHRANEIKESLSKIKPEFARMLKQANSQQISIGELEMLNKKMIIWHDMYRDIRKGWNLNGRLRYFYELIRYMDDRGIGLLENTKNSIALDKLKVNLEKYKIQTDSALSHRLRDYQNYVKGVAYECMANIYNKIQYPTLWEAADETFLDEIRVDIAKRLIKMR